MTADRPDAAARAGEQTAETDAGHFPWHYTEFGVVCVCGAPMRDDETCPAEAVSRSGGCPDCVHAPGAHHHECTVPTCGCDRSADEFANNPASRTPSEREQS